MADTDLKVIVKEKIMTKKRDLNLNKYNISSARYGELKYFCLQYPEWKHTLNTESSLIKSIQLTGLPGAHNISDTTSLIALKRTELSEKCNLIEQTAIEANPYIYQYILKNVTEDIPFKCLLVPCGKDYFYQARRKFFYLLSQKR